MARKKSNTKLVSIIVIAAILILSGVVTHIFNGGDKLFADAGLKNSPASDKMYVNFIDVNQGDCALFTCGGKNILIDCGEYAELQNVTDYLNNQNVKKLDLVIATHPHSDHIGCMGSLLKEFEVGDVIMPDVPEKIIPTTKAYEKFLEAASERAENVYAAEAGETYSYGEMKVQILGPVADYDDLNNESVVAKITYGTTSVMMCGDAEKKAEWDILKKNYNFNADILKLGHHGSKTSSSYEWLEAVNPKYAIVSCGENNDYGHPHKQTITKMNKYGIEYFRTDLLGDIVFVSDGKAFTRVTEN